MKRLASARGKRPTKTESEFSLSGFIQLVQRNTLFPTPSPGEGWVMKGIIFNLLEKVVVTAHGEDMWDDMIEDAGVSGIYTSLGSYPDQEIEALVASACRMTGLSRGEVLQWLGQQALPLIRDAYPQLFAGHKSSRDFVLSVNDKIHPEVRKLYPEASCPFFHIKATSQDTVTLEYKSPRDMAELAHGFITGAAQIYGDNVDVVVGSSQPGGKLDNLDLQYDPR